jgi:hypothetical protein
MKKFIKTLMIALAVVLGFASIAPGIRRLAYRNGLLATTRFAQLHKTA